MQQDLQTVFKHPFFWGMNDEEKHYMYNVWVLRAKREPGIELPWTESYRKYYERITRERMKQKKQMQSTETIDKHPMAETLKAMRRVFNANFGSSSETKESVSNNNNTSTTTKGVWGSGMRATVKRGIEGAKNTKPVPFQTREIIQLEKSEQIVSDFEFPPILRNPSEWRKALIKKCKGEFDEEKKKGLVAKTMRIPDFNAVENTLVLKRASMICNTLLRQKPVLEEQLIETVSSIPNLDDFMWFVAIDPNRFLKAWNNPLTWFKRISCLPTLSYKDVSVILKGYQNLEKQVVPELSKNANFLLSTSCYDDYVTSFVSKLDGPAKYTWIHFDRFIWSLTQWCKQRSNEKNSLYMQTWLKNVIETTVMNQLSAYWRKVLTMLQQPTRETDIMRILFAAIVHPIQMNGLTELPYVLVDKVQSAQ